MERYWELTKAQIRNPLAQRFNISPTSIVPMLRLGDDGLEEVAARWGLIPFWWKEERPPKNTFNARSEEGATKAMWRVPLSKARCVVPALGWYEWKEVERIDPTTGEVTKAKQPYYIHRPNGDPVAFAGLMSWKTIDGVDQNSCSIITRDAVGPVAEIHGRMVSVRPTHIEC